MQDNFEPMFISEPLEVPDSETLDKHDNNRKRSLLGKILKITGKFFATLLITLIILCIGLYGVMAILVKGPSPTAKKQFILSVQETSGVWWLAYWFCSKEEVETIKAENSVKDSTDVTDTDLIVINPDTAGDDTTPDIEIIDIKGSTYKGKLMIVKDPSRVFVGTVPQFANTGGMSVARMAERYGAIGGVNGGEFVDGTTTYTGMPVGLVMVDGQIKNGSRTGTTYHVTGITYDNKLVCGNMTGQQAIDMNIRDCVSIHSYIGPFLIINGQAQDIAGIGGGTNPRTAVGQRADGAILLLAVDGRQANSIGASFSNLQDIMFQYGAVNASTMDGGTSTQMYYNGEVINVPYSPTGPRNCPTSWLVK